MEQQIIEDVSLLTNQMNNELKQFVKDNPASTQKDLSVFLKGYQSALNVLNTYLLITQNCKTSQNQ